MGKVHGMIIGRAGKVRNQTPKVEKKPKKKPKTGRAKKRKEFNAFQESDKKDKKEISSPHPLPKKKTDTLKHEQSDYAKPNASKEEKEEESQSEDEGREVWRSEIRINPVNEKPYYSELSLLKDNTIRPYNIYDQPTIQIEKDRLIKMLKRENEIRFSDEIQKQYNDLKYEWNKKAEDYDLFRIDRELVVKLLREFGFKPEVDDSFEAYQIACGEHIDDPEIKELVIWMKYESKMKYGKLKVGDKFEDCKLLNLDLQEIHLSDILSKDKPNVILGGSMS